MTPRAHGPGDGTRVLYVGGTGAISRACVEESLRSGHEVWTLTRGRMQLRDPVEGAVHRTADVADPASVRAALGDERFDAVVDFVGFTPDDAARAVELFGDRTAQYVYISTVSVYDRTACRLPLTEAAPRRNPWAAYSRDKLAAEDVLLGAWREHGFPVTLVRPSHTYDEGKPPLPGGWTEIDRMVRGDAVVVPGDGTSLWTLTHAADLAVGLVGLLGDARTVGEAFHITSDEVLTWDQIYRLLADAAGVQPRLVHLPGDMLQLAAPDWRWTPLILGDLRFSTLLDTSKIRRYVPTYRPRTTWVEGARRILRWRRDHPGNCRPDPAVDAVLDRLVDAHRRAAEVYRSVAP